MTTSAAAKGGRPWSPALFGVLLALLVGCSVPEAHVEACACWCEEHGERPSRAVLDPFGWVTYCECADGRTARFNGHVYPCALRAEETPE